MRIRQRWNWPLTGLLAFYLTFSFFMITGFPKAWTDTSWVAVRGYTLATEGRVATPFLRGVQHRDEHTLAPHISQSVVLAATYKLLGFGLWQSRLPSILAGLLVALVTYWFARMYYGRNVALVALALLIFDNIFFASSRVVRPDIFLALFSTAGFFLLYHGLHKGSLRHIMLAGASIGVALYTHPHVLFILLAILLLFLQRFQLSVLRTREFWCFGLFALLTFSPYAIYVVREDFANGFSHLATQLIRKSASAERDYLHDLLRELRRYEDYIYFPYRVLIFSLQAVAFICGLFSKKSVDRQIALVVLVVVVLFPVVRPYNGNSFYFVVLIPFLSILIASLFFRVRAKVEALRGETSRRRAVRWLAPAANVVVILYVLNGFSGNAGILYLHRHSDFDRFFDPIRKQIPPGSRVLGLTSFWMGLYDYPYITPASAQTTVADFRPAYAVLYDRHTWKKGTALTGRAQTNVTGILSVDLEATYALCREQGTLVGRVEDDIYGHVQIFSLHWDP